MKKTPAHAQKVLVKTTDSGMTTAQYSVLSTALLIEAVIRPAVFLMAHAQMDVTQLSTDHNALGSVVYNARIKYARIPLTTASGAAQMGFTIHQPAQASAVQIV